MPVPNLQIVEAPQCCPTGVCGPEADDSLVRINAHLGFSAPAAATGLHDECLSVFAGVEFQIARRIRQFLSLPIDKIDSLSLQLHVLDMGETVAAI